MKRNVLMALCAGWCVMGAAGVARAEAKKDVTDPVLQEVITSFTQRMPRFVDKHGAGLFVADEPITRSSLMMALYEYDKSFKIPTREYATRQELMDIKARLVMLERSVANSSGTAQGGHDIAQIINDLAPNMPILLDNSLDNSRVFSRLKSEVVARQGSAGAGGKPLPSADVADLARRMDRLERSVTAAPAAAAGGVSAAELAAVNRRLERLERTPVPGATVTDAAPATDVAALNEEVQRVRVQARRDMVKLEKRLADVEKASSAGGGGSASGESRQYSSLLTKMSFGLSMLAALFIAR